MKKLLTTFALALMVTPASAALDTNLRSVWDRATNDGKALHFLDNGAVVSLYDFNRKEYLGGVTTSLYHPTIKGMKPLSGDIGMVRSLEAGHSTFPLGAVRFHGRELMAKNAQAKAFIESRQNLLKYMTCGVWAARDWNYGIWRYGGFLGGEAKW